MSKTAHSIAIAVVAVIMVTLYSFVFVASVQARARGPYRTSYKVFSCQTHLNEYLHGDGIILKKTKTSPEVILLENDNKISPKEIKRTSYYCYVGKNDSIAPGTIYKKYVMEYSIVDAPPVISVSSTINEVPDADGTYSFSYHIKVRHYSPLESVYSSVNGPLIQEIIASSTSKISRYKLIYNYDKDVTGKGLKPGVKYKIGVNVGYYIEGDHRGEMQGVVLTAPGNIRAEDVLGCDDGDHSVIQNDGAVPSLDRGLMSGVLDEPSSAYAFGDSIFTKDSITFNFGAGMRTSTDTCLSNQSYQLLEMACAQKPRDDYARSYSLKVVCPNGCENGACKK